MKRETTTSKLYWRRFKRRVAVLRNPHKTTDRLEAVADAFLAALECVANSPTCKAEHRKLAQRILDKKRAETLWGIIGISRD